MKKNLPNYIKKIRSQMLPTLKKEGVVKAGVFGSFAHGAATRNSDIDLLLAFDKQKSLFDLSSLRLALQDKLKRDVDILTYPSIYPPLRDQILEEQIIIYEKDQRSKNLSQSHS